MRPLFTYEGAGFCLSINTVIYNMITAVSTNIFTSGRADPENDLPKMLRINSNVTGRETTGHNHTI